MDHLPSITKRLSPSDLSKALVFFIFLVCTSIISATGWQIYESSLERVATAEISVSNIVRAVEQQAQDTVKQADYTLRDIAERVTHDGTGEEQRSRLSKVMRQRLEGAKDIQGLFLYDANGNWVANSFSQNNANKNNGDREYFTYHKIDPNLSIRIGSIIKSRTTGDMIIPISRRINNTDGSFAGVALATIPTTYFDDFFLRMNVDENGVIFLAMENGDLLARRPTLTGLMTTNISKGEIFSRYLSKSDSGTAIVKSVVDKIERVYAYRRLTDLPIVAAAGMSLKHVFAPWWSYVYRSCAIIGLIIITLFFLARSLYRQIAHLILAESQLSNARSELEIIAQTDSLTLLPNRRSFDDSLHKEWKRANRNQSNLSIILFDIDWFKQYNDTYGHLQGDECLKKVSKTIASLINRPGDVAARYGGEEFVILLPDTDLTGALNVAEKLRRAIAEEMIEHSASCLKKVTISGGAIVVIPSDKDTPLDALVEADKLLYLAKSLGRNRVEGRNLVDILR